MGKMRIKLDLSELTDEIIVESKWIECQEDIESETGWNEIVGAIIERIKVIKEEFINQ